MAPAEVYAAMFVMPLTTSARFSLSPKSETCYEDFMGNSICLELKALNCTSGSEKQRQIGGTLRGVKPLNTFIILRAQLLTSMFSFLDTYASASQAIVLLFTCLLQV